MTDDINRTTRSKTKLMEHLNTEMTDIKVAYLIQHV